MPEPLSEAEFEREKQRSDSEARDIIHDVQRLFSYDDEKKTRWIWELLQNAKDVAKPDKVDIVIKLTPNKLEFSHNGLPFETNHLLAILYKTSTKSLDGKSGTTGKYGTGFVTTHILNRRLTVSGTHKNDKGERKFSLNIDRSSAYLDESEALGEMKKQLKTTFDSISEITQQPVENIAEVVNTFSYDLNAETFVYAEKGVEQLQKNLAFTLLVNQERIKSITIIHKDEKTYKPVDETTGWDTIKFVSVDSETGLLYYKQDELIFGIPAKKSGESFNLLPIQHQAILYKEFPLLGTEDFNLPVFIQHKQFHPTELRNGIRTKKNSSDEPDPTAEKNCDALLTFEKAYIPFINKLIEAKLSNIHLLSKSGLPVFADSFFDNVWYEKEIQKPIRSALLSKDVVLTYSGELKRINQARFILQDEAYYEEFYKLACGLIPDQLPTEDSVWYWADTISQEQKSWSEENIVLTVDGLLSLIPIKLDLSINNSIQWLKDLYTFLRANSLSHLGSRYPIYPNEVGEFCVEEKVRIYPDIDDEYKIISAGLGRSLEKEFLDKRLNEVEEISPFDLDDFYKKLNESITAIKVEAVSESQLKAIFRICCLFRSGRALKKEEWYRIISELLPNLVIEQKIISVDYENYYRSAEYWCIRYICYLIEKSVKPSLFAQHYFEGSINVCFEWLNRFLDYLFQSEDDAKEANFKKKIIPVQSDVFVPYTDKVYGEENPKYFTDSIKDIYRDYIKIDPRTFLVDSRISSDNINRKEISELTQPINRLFLDENIEKKVKKEGGTLNEMFMQLNHWFEKFNKPEELLPTFASKRNTLYVLALGEGFSKQIMDIQNSGKSIKELADLANINLTTQQIESFASIAEELGKLGAEAILAKAQEMLDAKHQRDRWKAIGNAAEEAFKQAIANIDIECEILNPDLGKDFSIMLQMKEYAVEIKSVGALKGNVNMSILQGRTAVREKDCYALCVLSRPLDNTEIDVEYFIRESKYITDIGTQIGDKIAIWDNGLQNLDTHADVKVSLDSKAESIYVNRNIWKDAKPFDEFVEILKHYFSRA